MKAALTAFCLLAAWTAWAQTDKITIGMRVTEGKFHGFRDDQFVFRTSDGETIRENRRNVRSLELEEPVKVSYELKRGDSGAISAKLTGYRAMRFVLEEDGKERKVFSNAVNSMRVHAPPSATGQSGGSRGPSAIPRIDTSDVENNPNLSPEQKKAIDQYKAARNNYEQFLTESSDLVRKRDQAQGADRHRYIQKLRLRNQKEQPILQSLQAATRRLYNAFPEEPDEAEQETGEAPPADDENPEN